MELLLILGVVAAVVLVAVGGFFFLQQRRAGTIRAVNRPRPSADDAADHGRHAAGSDT